MQLKRNKEMKFETLKKSYKRQIIIGALAACIIGGALTFATTRAKYKLTEDLELARGTINYKPYDFKVMAMYKSEDGTNYTEITDRMPTSGYIINDSKSYCTLDNKNKDTNAILKTINGNHIISNLSKSDKCYLYFDKKTSVDNASELLVKVQSEAKSTTPTTFAAGATTDEGVYSVSDPVYGGTSYYWRGLVTNNYVRFADKCWRIVRINGDGSIRIIYDGTTCHANGTNADSIAVASIEYNTSKNQPYYVGWTYGSGQRPTLSTDSNGLSTGGTSSNAKTQLENWYKSNITGTNATKVASGKYCNDRDAEAGSSYGSSTFKYAATKRIVTDHVPSLACSTGDRYALKVGLITVDEAMYAGGTNKSNSSYYLYSGQTYWTMSPHWWNGDGSYAVVFRVDADGYLGGNYSVDSSCGLRPVINLKSDVTFSSGDGTLNSPYIVQ